MYEMIVNIYVFRTRMQSLRIRRHNHALVVDEEVPCQAWFKSVRSHAISEAVAPAAVGTCVWEGRLAAASSWCARRLDRLHDYRRVHRPSRALLKSPRVCDAGSLLPGTTRRPLAPTAAMYLASMLDFVMVHCLREAQVIGTPARWRTWPKIDLRPSRSLARSVLE